MGLFFIHVCADLYDLHKFSRLSTILYIQDSLISDVTMYCMS